MASDATSLVTFVTTDYAGITRGRSVVASSYTPGRAMSAGWVPANMSLTPFDQIAHPNPWGSTGDLRLLADEAARYRLRPEGSATDLDMEIVDEAMAQVDGAGQITAPAHTLYEIVRKLPEGSDVELRFTGEHPRL